ncbi:vWA domain-containing protein [Nonomuraea candida]|uniref:vWA domain-containing protein n=1 Tax=Nonomuraea candida TaxID=359159 RepID=UPI0005BDFDE2|nr:vWA domain-containing protein [Nonomuraea candida]
MPSSRSREHDPHDGGDESPPPRQDHPRAIVVQAVVSTLVGVIVTRVWTDFATFTDRFPGGHYVGMALLVGVAFLVLGAASRLSPRRLRRAVAERAGRVWRWLCGWIPHGLRRPAATLRLASVFRLLPAVYLAAVAGACVVALGLGGGWAYRQLGFVPCGSPEELTVMTAPENVAALRADVEKFVRDRSEHGCALHRVSVYPEASVEELAYGFENDWQRDGYNQHGDPYTRLLIPRPDLWVATTTEELGLVLGPASPVAAVPLGEAGTDRMTLAVANLRYGDFDRFLPGRGQGRSLDAALSAARERLRMRLVYPEPSLSVAGLVAAAQVVDTDSGKDMARSAGLGGTVVETLCRFRTGPAGERRHLAFLVPSRAVDDLNAGGPGLPGCPGPPLSNSDALRDVKPEGGALLTHPIYGLTWPGDDRVRQEAVRELAGWLRDRRPLDARPGPAGTPMNHDLGAVRERISAKLPSMSVQVALDGSGSMAESPSSLLARIRDAFAAVRPALGLDDRLSVSLFHRPADGGRVVRFDSAVYHRRDWDRLLTRLVPGPARARDAPISQVLRELGGRLDAPGRPVVVITDGGPFRSDEKDDQVARAIERAARDARTVLDVHILVVGDAACPPGLGRGPAPEGGVTCAAVAHNNLEDALRDLVSAMRGRAR